MSLSHHISHKLHEIVQISRTVAVWHCREVVNTNAYLGGTEPRVATALIDQLIVNIRKHN